MATCYQWTPLWKTIHIKDVDIIESEYNMDIVGEPFLHPHGVQYTMISCLPKMKMLILIAVIVSLVSGCGKEPPPPIKDDARRTTPAVKKIKKIKVKAFEQKKIIVDLGNASVNIQGLELMIQDLTPADFFNNFNQVRTLKRRGNDVRESSLNVIAVHYLDELESVDVNEDVGKYNPIIELEDRLSGFRYTAKVIVVTDAKSGKKTALVRQILKVPTRNTKTLTFSEPLPAISWAKEVKGFTPGEMTVDHLNQILGDPASQSEEPIGSLETPMLRTGKVDMWPIDKDSTIQVEYSERDMLISAIPLLMDDIELDPLKKGNVGKDVRQRDPDYKFPPMAKIYEIIRNKEEPEDYDFLIVETILCERLIDQLHTDFPDEPEWEYMNLSVPVPGSINRLMFIVDMTTQDFMGMDLPVELEERIQD